MVDDWRAFQDERMNTILYVLTIVTTAIVPGQFLTGLYGMNFVTEEGKPAMPELLWRHGYLYFWVATITSTVLMLSYFRFSKWI